MTRLIPGSFAALLLILGSCEASEDSTPASESQAACNWPALSACTDLKSATRIELSCSAGEAVAACASGAIGTCESTGTAGPATYTKFDYYYEGADIDAASTRCTSAGGTWNQPMN